ncbi:MAG: electron transfer flavoprotein-ubiquinone oxidoreductase [Candidatus Sericytochromatia bacterium]|nr:electron transfer flavoprotein-ubiquinone oxidoreductase [Candidatus Sericytochromatia bacterium]
MTIAREQNPVDVLFVGAGPASLAGAIHLARLVKAHNAKNPAAKLDDPMIAVLEKSAEVGYHGFSGAVMDPKSLRKLFPDFDAAGVPVESPVTEDEVWFMTASRKLKLPITPPPLQNHGNFVVSLQKLVAWLAQKAEEEGVTVAPGYPAAELLYDDQDRVTGVRTTDQGLDHHGQPKGNFQPGMDFLARCVVLGEGTRGTLTKALIQKKQLDAGKNPQVWACGVKELWKVKPEKFKKGRVIHTMGFPLKADEFGGGFIYHLDHNLVYVGQVGGLDTHDPTFDPHLQLQRLKTHPAIAELLDGAELVRYGAKTIPEGGYWSIPRLYDDGVVLVGDSGSLLNPMRLKGIHTAIESGIQAAETIFEGLLAQAGQDPAPMPASLLAGYEQRILNGEVGKELYAARNFHQSFEDGLYPAMFFHIPLQMVTGGRGLHDRYAAVPGYRRMRKLKDKFPDGRKPQSDFKPDGKLTFSKLDDVYRSGTKHEENQPPHLRIADWNICNTRCKEEYGNPCQHFCPAAVYEMVDLKGNGQTELKLNPSNCVHCKTCDIADPYQLITWVAPEGGGGPVYVGM